MDAESPDTAWFDQQYNPRLGLKDIPAFFAAWDSDSAAARARMDCELDIAYGDDPLETLDVYRTEAADAPVLFFIHGGYWRASDKTPHAFVAEAFVRGGVSVVMINYPLCPRVRVEDVVDSTARALAWTWRHIAAHGGDPTNILVTGHSAGGHLAAMMACHDWTSVGADLPGTLASNVLAISAINDMEPISRVPFLKDSLNLAPESVRALSPFLLVPCSDATVASVAGALESNEYQRHNRMLRESWGESRVPVCELIEDRDHFTIVHDLGDPTRRLHQLALALMGKSV